MIKTLEENVVLDNGFAKIYQNPRKAPSFRGYG